MADGKENQEGQVGDFPGRMITPLYFNSFYLNVQSQTTRFTMGETVYSNVPANFSSTFVMPTEVATDLALKILQLAINQGVLKLQDVKLTEKPETDYLA